MESKTNKTVKVFRDKQEVLRLLKEYTQSGLSVKQFCNSQGIPEGTFYNWKEKYAKGSTIAEKAGFTPVQIVPAPVGLFAEIGSIKIYQPVSAAYLKELSA